MTRSAANVKEAVPFFAIADMAASLRFYVDGLGFTVVNRWIVDEKIRWCLLTLDSASIMLQQFGMGGEGSWVPSGKVGDGVSICFMCDDAIAMYHHAKARGLEVKRPFVGNGLWVTSLSDPDGYRLDFESPTDVSEETEYADSAE